MPAYRADLTDRVISAEQGKPVALLARGKSIARWTDGDAGNGNGSKRRLPCKRADRGCVASWGQDHLAGNGADFLLVISSRTLEEPMHEAKANDDGVSHWCSFTHDGDSTAARIGSKSVSSRSDSFCTRPRSRFSWGRFWVLEPDEWETFKSGC